MSTYYNGEIRNDGGYKSQTDLRMAELMQFYRYVKLGQEILERAEHYVCQAVHNAGNGELPSVSDVLRERMSEFSALEAQVMQEPGTKASHLLQAGALELQ